MVCRQCDFLHAAPVDMPAQISLDTGNIDKA
jgi:hypothetical protein